MKLNPIVAEDFYKTGHIVQYPKKTELVYANFTPRSSRLAQKIKEIFNEKIVWFGMQGFVQWFLIDLFNKEFFSKPKDEVVAEYKRLMDNGLGTDAVNCDHIAALHDLGYLPVHIKALPEGSLVNIKVPVMTIVNTIPEFYWLTNYLEDSISNNLWKPCTTATTALQYRKLLEDFAEMTGASKDFVLWQGHDFSCRGMSGTYDSAASSSGHLLSFYGTDTISSICYLEDYYFGKQTFVGGSVPATEHSVMCMGGMEDEVGTIRRLITEVYPSGVVSIVSDTWDFWNVITNTSVILKEEILARKENALGLAKVVFRPDSGDPVDIVAGLRVVEVDDLFSFDVVEEIGYTKFDAVKYEGKYYKFELTGACGSGCCEDNEIKLLDEVPLHEVKGAVECLWDIFGGTTTAKGYKELNPRVGLIYGDSITLERAKNILERLKAKGFASSNIVFGIGSFTYQYVTRDSFGFAMKATYGIVDGVPRSIYKDPKTGDGGKKSAKGLLRVEKEGDNFVLYDEQTPEQEQQGALQTVFKDGRAYNIQTLAQIREVMQQSL